MENKQLELFKIAKLEEGVQEFDPGSNPRIVEYHSCTTLKAKDDDIPWCASFVNWVCVKAGVMGTRSAAAKSFLNWGKEITKPEIGDLVILYRDGSPGDRSKAYYHVGFYEGDHQSLGNQLIKVFGGNQGNSVCSRWFPASRIVGYRRCKD